MNGCYQGTPSCKSINIDNRLGVMRPGSKREDWKAHAIGYMDGTSLAICTTEGCHMVKKLMAVRTTNSAQKFHQMSRIHFGKTYTVD
jgi:hypothetical protein